MRRERVLKYAVAILGSASSAFLAANYFIFANLRPKMVQFNEIGATEENLMVLAGIGLLLFFLFCSFSLLRLAQRIKRTGKITPVSALLIVSGVLSFLFVFADLALLNDINKQYTYGLAQPEWSILFPIITFQLITAVAFTCLSLFERDGENQAKGNPRDNSTFLAVQYVGITCGLVGLTLSSLGFVFPRAWLPGIHGTISCVILLAPYALALVYWLLSSLPLRMQKWHVQGVGKSSLLTLTASVIFMVLLFLGNYGNLGGVVSILWFPLYTFLVLFVFSLGNLWFSRGS